MPWRERLLGKARDPLSTQSRHSLTLAAFFAWVALGADGLSSVIYGPAEAFRALDGHTHLALLLALATAVTVWVVALAYNQVIELFPTGGGGYRVSTAQLGPKAGLVSGSALVVDYVLTIAISIAAASDAIFSFLPPAAYPYKLLFALFTLLVLSWANLGGKQTSPLLLVPVFCAFVLSHVAMILWGIAAQSAQLGALVPATLQDIRSVSQQEGWLFVLALFIRAYSLGAGTYTGIEIVSNNVDKLTPPVLKTGKLTMRMMAASLSLMAAGIVVLYLLWQAAPQTGETLNATVFNQMLSAMGLSGSMHGVSLVLLLLLEAGVLWIAANAGFLGGPAVLSNMASDSWVPHRFRYLSNRLVTENGIVLMGLAATATLLLTGGSVALLIVLYSINVFLTFTLSLLGMSRYWYANRKTPRLRGQWKRRLALSGGATLLCATILLVLIIQKFFEGGWITLLLTSLLVMLCMLTRRHYQHTRREIQKVDQIFAGLPYGSNATPPAPQADAPTAAFIVGSSRGGGLHAVLWVQRMFPDHFKNFVFINARTVDAQVYGGAEKLATLRMQANTSVKYFERFCNSFGLAADSRIGFGTDAVNTLEILVDQTLAQYPNTLFFASKLVFKKENFVTRLLHNQAISALQHRMHVKGQQLMVLPMRLD